jgi:hypothetical protein
LVDLAEIQAAYYMVAATGVLVAAAYYILNLRHTMKASEMEMCRLVSSEHISDQGLQRLAIVMKMEWRDPEDFMEKYGYSNPELFGKWTSQCFFYETVGAMIKKKVLDAELVYALGAWGAIRVWEKFKDVVQSRRGVAWGLDYMVNFEFLAQEMLRIKTRNDASFNEKLEAYRKSWKP